MKSMYRLIGAVALVAALTACQSAKTEKYETEAFEAWPIAPGQSLIQTEVLGFSPLADTGKSSIEFALYFANASAVKSWSVTLATLGVTKQTFSGSSTYLPPLLTWDGKDSNGKLAPEGTYVATLTVNYSKPYTKGTAKSTSFILDVTKPTGKISYKPELFSFENPTDAMTITINGKSSLARIDSWSMYIFDPGWNLFRSYTGKWPKNSVVWDGKDMDGNSVMSAEDYPVTVKLRDEFGNTGTIESSLPIDIIVIKDGTGYRIENSRIYFKNYTADYENVPEDLSRQNIVRLNRLAETFKKYPDHKVRIVGHAVKIFWEDKSLGEVEQEKVLKPLSLARAEAIKKAMVVRGVNPNMITTEGVGASDPLVPDSDFANRWVNRRTAFFLIK